ncbi:general secretion pathway protein GspB [Glaciecola petra]|uniref:General secretion pathway protein GspB n=1 Tax=Glaciecola petra TaxID=3075602 RepID=A0ABU2ZV44_9ALTE|nr:general secretion pathway protein GspB [Aestuariibacter sp. P117]MDT0595913.1 general secretion pathway protein GspB [Aestuariibacter sp. P117]
MLKTLNVEELVPGMMVTQVVRQSGPVRIRKVGIIRSPDMIKGLVEMGVEELEVDLAQSLGIDDEAQEDSPTATQRLVASNKQIEDVDRQLSQQFHRSLFLPAVDQMPSKWALYGKPYSIVLGLLVLGLTIGWFIVTLPLVYLNGNQSEALTINAIEAANNKPTTIVDDASSQTSTSDITESEDSNKLASTNLSIDEPISGTDAEQGISLENSNNLSTNDASNNGLANESAAPTSDTNTDDVQINTFQGVVLEEGQQVLGYQAPASSQDANTLDSSNTDRQDSGNSNEGSGNNLSDAELMRRLQQAIQEVDNQERDEQAASASANEQVETSDLPRIDQLSAATLTQMPAMSFSAHMYSSNSIDRWVRVNGRRLGEGEIIGDGVTLKGIEPEIVVLEFKGQTFTMNALSDW